MFRAQNNQEVTTLGIIERRRQKNLRNGEESDVRQEIAHIWRLDIEAMITVEAIEAAPEIAENMFETSSILSSFVATSSELVAN